MGRLPRRDTYVRALNTSVPYSVISAINLWQKIDKEKGTRHRFVMLEHYADVVLMLEIILKFSMPMCH